MNLKFYPNSIYSKTVAAIKLLLFFCTLFVTSASLGGSGIYQTYVIINKGTGNEYYGGGINSQNATAFNGLNLGSFCPTSTLLLNGGEVLTFKNGISDVFGANIFYRVYSTSGTGGSLTQIDLPFTCQFPTNPCPGTFNNGDQKWARTAHNVNVLSGLTPGTYFLEVYWNSPNSDGGTFDSNFGANFKATFTVLPPALSATVTPVSCFGGNNGAINLTASCLAGLPPVTQTYEQNFNSLASSPTNTNITWTDNSTIANWYTNRLTYRVSNGSDLTGSLYSFGSNSDRALGSIASGATGQILGAVRITNTTTQTITSVNVNYFGEQWRNGGNTTKHKLIFAYSTNATDDNAGTYIAFPTLDFEGPVATSTAGILDGNLSANRLNISGIIPVTLAPGQSIWLRWADADDTGSDHGLSIDDLTVTLSSAGSGFGYSWTGPNGFTAATEDISGLVAGNYTVTVTGSNGSATATYSVTQPNAIVINESVQQVSCNGGNNGAINITVTGGTGNLTYSWSNGATSEDISNLTAGIYTITVKDGNNCSLSKQITVTQPSALSVSVAKTDASCFGGNNGSINLTVTGGTSPYTFTWSNNASSEDISSLVAGNYSVLVSDANGCTATANVTINQPAQITISANALNSVLCKGGNTTITAATNNATIFWQQSANGTSDWTNVPACNELYISEYVEGSSNLKAIEIYNGTGVPVDLSAGNYQLKFYFNGSSSPATVISLTGILAPNDVYVIADDNSGAAVLASADQISTLSFFNGDDAIALTKNNNNIDVIGQIGVDPGTQWGSGSTGTADHTLRRKPTLRCAGDVNGFDAFDPSLEWDGYPIDNIENLGSHLVHFATGDINSTIFYRAVYSKTGCADVVSNTVQITVTDITVTVTPGTIACNGGTTAVTVSATGGTAPYTGTGSFNVGAGTYTYTVTDANGCSASTTITVIEPAVLNASASAGVLICPSGTVNVTVNASGGTAPYTGTGNFTRGAGTHHFTVTDANGCTTTTSITINATNTAPVLQSITPSSYAPVAIGTSIGLSINYNDPNNNVTTAAVNWDDGSAIQIVNNPAAAFTLNRTYANPGVYSVTVTLTDACGLTSTARYDYVVVFDPTGGFVTGGGWINSPAGALADNPLLTGRANFGFVAKYKKGSNVPDGNTEFQFQAGNFNFKSMEYDAGWLVISGSKATFRGSGTVNGSGNFGFLVVAVDGQISGGGGFDKFRIKIWDKSNGNRVVYDNDMGMDDNGIPSTAIAGGSIVIHNPKKSANTNLNFSTEQPLAILPVSFNVKVLGNPTLSKFVLKLESDDMNTPMTIKVVDVSGRILEVKQNIRPGQLVEFGTNYKLGTYFAEVVQGEQRKVVQLIKIER